MGETRVQAICLAEIGVVALEQYDHQGAVALLEESIAWLRSLDEISELAAPLNALSWAVLEQGDVAQAQALFAESLTLCRELGDQLGIARGLAGIAQVALSQGQLERAAYLYQAAEELRMAIDAALPLNRCTRHEHAVERAVGQGITPSTAAYAVKWAMSPEQAVSYALDGAVAQGTSTEYTMPPCPALAAAAPAAV
jgi:hypothetical protein